MARATNKILMGKQSIVDQRQTDDKTIKPLIISTTNQANKFIITRS